PPVLVEVADRRHEPAARGRVELAGGEGSVSTPGQDAHSCASGGDEVDPAVTIDVTGGDRERIRYRRVIPAAAESAGPVAQQDRHRAAQVIRAREVETSVSVQVRKNDGFGFRTDRKGGG